MMDISLTNNVYFYLISMLVTSSAVLVAVLSFIVVRRRGLQLDQLEQKIPDAARYEDLQHRLLEAEDLWTEYQEKLGGARDLIAQKEEAEMWLDKNQELLTSVEAERQQQESLRAELEEVQRRLSERQQQMENLQREASEAQFRMNTAKETAEKLECSVEALEKQQSELKQNVAKLEVEHNKLEMMCEKDRELAGEIKSELSRLEQQRGELEKEHKELRQQCAELKAEVYGLENVKNRLLVDTGKHKDRLADLWEPVLKDTSDGIMPDDEQECLLRVRVHMDELGLIFPERVIHAFHTSLKVADISPLVVLAGISGTGKSELPYRYAQGMGMHFLNLAVQPRWDSPQDMFGFFNYIEGRYRATELARALVQMDPYFTENGRGWDYPKEWKKNNLCHQMLLVLLDEMNLARVEYYFSEFLSRLEIRRSIDPNVPMDRRKAEIPLEVGGAGGADSILRLFVHTNVLFVGTMNEDETTQTLSDKVVDRANVMRFGKPSRFPDQNTHEGARRNTLNIPLGNWEEWLRTEDDLTKDYSDQVNEWIVRLNNLMGRIHRPFAHRTHQAIRKYAANYPTYSDSGIRLAMADQIEQKILPKFRGLDMGDQNVGISLDELVDLIQELNDSKLVEAVAQARGEEEHLFIWQGVDRITEEESV